MISHREAETLISARLDQELDPLTERELSAHLATCPQCRAFARSTEALATGMRELPYLPASPAVSRGVMARVDQGRSPWTNLGGWLANPGPALSTLAIIAVVLLLGFFVLNRFVLDGGTSPDDNNQLASQPTVPPETPRTFEIAGTPEPTATSEGAPTDAPPTKTVAPTETQAPEPTATTAPEPTATNPPEPTATEPPAPTATTPPEPTATEPPAPTATNPPEPTATNPPEPTATEPPAPTATTPPEPTATNEPVVIKNAPQSTPDVTDLTGAGEGATPTESPATTPEPTEPSTPETPPITSIEPTATPEETPAPTETAPPEPTPTRETTPEQVSTPEGSDEAPPILPIDGGQVVEAPEEIEATSTAEANAPEPTQTPVDDDVAIQPIGTNAPEEGTETAPIEAETPGDGTGNGTILPIEGTPSSEGEIEPTGTETPASGEPTPTEPAADDGTIDLDANSEVYGDIAGDPSGRLVLDDGRMEYQPQAHPAILTSVNGVEASTTSTDGGQAITLCVGGDCTDVSSESTEGPATDTPLSWINGTLIYHRNASGATTYHALVPDESGTGVASDTVLYDGGSALEPTFPVFLAEGQVWVVTQGSGWLVFTDSTAHLYENGYSNPQLLRFANAGGGAIVSYVSGGQLIVAPASTPGAPIATVTFSGVDFDISPGGDRIAISTGTSIEIYDLNGTLVSTYASPDMQPGTVLWLNSGIVFHDSASGILMQIPDPQT